MFRLKSNKLKPAAQGFTLIEILVSVAIFTMVVVVSVGGLVVILNANRKTQSIATSVNNAFFATETMTRLMRTGYNYHCGTTGTLTLPLDCPSNYGSTDVYFTDDRGYFVHVFLQITGGVGTIMEEIDSTAKNGTAFDAAYPLTAVDFNVQTLIFDVTGTIPESSGSADHAQPKTTITLYGIANANNVERAPLSLQTTVTQRLLDL